MNRSVIISEYVRVNRKFEVAFMPKVRRAIHVKVKAVINDLKEGGFEQAKRNLHREIGNDELKNAIKSIYTTVGLRHARLTYSRLLNESRGRKSFTSDDFEQKGFGFNAEWTSFILDYLKRFLLDKITFRVAETTRNALLRALTVGVTAGFGIDGMIAQLEEWPFERYQAARILRTEVNRASNVGAAAQESTGEYEQQKEWLSVQDYRTRGHKPKDHANHVALNGTKIDADDEFVDPRNGDRLRFPGDPNAKAESTVNCFLPDTKIEGQIVGGQRLKYSGKVIEIITSFGNRLTVTPNHPVFTNKGTIPADLIANGDYVLSNVKKTNNISLTFVENNIEQKPILAANIFRTLVNSFGFQKCMSVGLDFNGDSKFGDGNIDIVDINRELQFCDNSLIEDIGNFSLETTSLERILVSRFCSQYSFSNRNVPAYSGGMSGGDLLFPTIDAHLRPFKFFSIGTATKWNASRYEVLNECGTTDNSFIRKLLHGNTGQIAFDKIINIREYNFVGHVYDFTTLSGAILANCIYISNCRCNVAFVNKRDANGDLIPKRRSTSVIYPGQIRRNPVITI